MFRRAFYGGIFLAALLAAQNPATTVTVDASANRHAINPNIYGVAYGDATTLPDLNVPLNRYGGANPIAAYAVLPWNWTASENCQQKPVFRGAHPVLGCRRSNNSALNSHQGIYVSSNARCKSR